LTGARLGRRQRIENPGWWAAIPRRGERDLRGWSAGRSVRHRPVDEAERWTYARRRGPGCLLGPGFDSLRLHWDEEAWTV